MTIGTRDPWKMLGVERSADDAAIKGAYRKLARKYHPDVNPGDQEASAMFHEIARAYELISSSDRRAAYLAEHEAAERLTGFGDDGLGGGSERRRRRGDEKTEIRETVTISFSEAYRGVQREIPLEMEDICSYCGGWGTAPGHKPTECRTCHGTGEHRVGRVSNVCSDCDGRGFKIEKPCKHCRDGWVVETRPQLLDIPAGVSDGHVMRLSGPKRGASKGADLHFTIRVKSSSIFQRTLTDPADLLVEVPIHYSEACFGAHVKIPTPSRVLSLTVPPYTQSGKMFRVNHEGMPKLDGSGHGNLFARVQVAIPTKLSSQQRRLIESLKVYDPDDLRVDLFREH